MSNRIEILMTDACLLCKGTVVLRRYYDGYLAGSELWGAEDGHAKCGDHQNSPACPLTASNRIFNRALVGLLADEGVLAPCPECGATPCEHAVDAACGLPGPPPS